MVYNIKFYLSENKKIRVLNVNKHLLVNGDHLITIYYAI